MRRSVVLIAVLLALPQSLNAQWKLVFPNATVGGLMGAMSFRDGRTWIAKDGILISDDSGKTWSSAKTLSTPYDLQFLDRMNGIAACQNGTYTTSDGGRSWSLFSNRIATSACFVGSPLVAVLADHAGTIDITTDGGKNWNFTTQLGYSFYVTTMRDGSIIYFAGTSFGGNLYRSTDLGFSWQQGPAGIDWDSYTFGVDSCQASRVYLSNEDAVAPTDTLSQIFVTTDLGSSWTTSILHPIDFFCGSVAVSRNAVYCPTISDGIYRSTDRGKNWISIHGPNCSYDTRLIAAIDDNIIIVTDDQGNIWRTINSGGDPVTNLTQFVVQPPQATIPDTIQACASANVGFRLVGMCPQPHLGVVKISGPDSVNFIATGITSDSVNVTFLPNGAKSYSAEMIVALVDGAEQRVPLHAVGAATPKLTFTTADVSNDTIGGNIYVPIYSSSRTFAGSVDLAILYDTTNLVYSGGYAALGPQDLTTYRAPGIAHLQFPNAARTMKDSLLGFAHFQIYPRDAACTSVTIDSIAITIEPQVCAVAQSPILSKVCGNLGCGTPTLSSFVRYDKMPSLTVVPNPSTGLSFIHSDIDLGEVTVEVFDALGYRVDRTTTTLSPSHPVAIHSNLFIAGAYQVRVFSLSVQCSLNLLHLH